MYRTCIILVGVLLAGCSKHSEVAVTSHPPSTMPAPGRHVPSDAGRACRDFQPYDVPRAGRPAMVPDAHSASRRERGHLRVAQDGKIYVFGFVDHMLAFQHAGKNQPVVIEKQNFTPKAHDRGD